MKKFKIKVEGYEYIITEWDVLRIAKYGALYLINTELGKGNTDNPTFFEKYHNEILKKLDELLVEENER